MGERILLEFHPDDRDSDFDFPSLTASGYRLTYGDVGLVINGRNEWIVLETGQLRDIPQSSREDAMVSTMAASLASLINSSTTGMSLDRESGF
jgi:hypothetical protein